MKKLLLIASISLVLLVVAGCSATPEGDDYITIIDMVGDEITLKKNPENVAVISRAAADMMIGFGLGDVVDGMFRTVLDNTWTELLYPGVKDY